MRSPVARSRTARCTRGGGAGVERRSTTTASRRPSGEKAGAPYSSSASSRSTRRSPVAVSIDTSGRRGGLPARGRSTSWRRCEPSGLTSSSRLVESAARRRGEVAQRDPPQPARRPSRRRARPVRGPRAGAARRGRGRGPRTAPGSSRAGSPRPWPPCGPCGGARRRRRRSAPGSVADVSTTVPVVAAATAPCTPPARTATTRASPPPAGRSQRAAGGVLVRPRPVGSGRAEVNSRPPSGRNAAGVSPLALRVSRRAGRSPAGRPPTAR